MNLAQKLGEKEFLLLAEADPPKGADPTGFLDGVLGIRGRVDAFMVTDGAQAIMRMTPLAPCRLLIERHLDPVLVLNGRDRNRISFQGDLLAGHALGVRMALFTEGHDPAIGDQPLARSSQDLNLEVMLQCAGALNKGVDLAGEPLAGKTEFLVGAALEPSDDVNVNRRRAESIARLAELGAHFVVLGPTYDVNIIELFSRQAQLAGVDLLASIMLLKSVAMIRYLNDLPGTPAVPHEFLKQMLDSPLKKQAGMHIAAGFLRDLKPLCRGAVIGSLGWGTRLPEFLDLIGR